MCTQCLTKAITNGTLTSILKSDPAITPQGSRTIWGPLVADDIPALHEAYPLFSSIDEMGEYVGLFHQPRLSEVAGPLELAYRMINGLYSTIKGLQLSVAYNPLSVLANIEGRIVRIKSKESELLHKSMEKLALRTKTLLGINTLFKRRFNIQIAFACSCGVGAVSCTDLPLFLESQYYMNREGNGRLFDSDIVAVGGNLFTVDSVVDIPKSILSASADVGIAEVESYLRYYATVSFIIEKNPAVIDLTVTDAITQFFTGEYAHV